MLYKKILSLLKKMVERYINKTGKNIPSYSVEYSCHFYQSCHRSKYNSQCMARYFVPTFGTIRVGR